MLVFDKRYEVHVVLPPDDEHALAGGAAGVRVTRQRVDNVDRSHCRRGGIEGGCAEASEEVLTATKRKEQPEQAARDVDAFS